MAASRKVVGVTVKPYESEALADLAAEKGISTSALAALYVRKGLKEERPEHEAQELVDSGFCPDLPEARKLLRFLGGRRDAR